MGPLKSTGRRVVGLIGLPLLVLLLLACGTSPSPSPTQLPLPTSAPSPAPTLVPIPTSIPNSSAAQDSGLEKVAFDNLVRLIKDLGPRESATEQEKAAADYLVNAFISLGYTAKLQPFTVNLFSRDSGLELVSPGPRKVNALPLVRSAEGEATGTLVDIGLALEGDLPAAGLQGKIALIRRGNITFQQKASRAQAAGAVAAIVYNNQPGGFQGTFTDPSVIPAVSISQEDGELIKNLMAQASVEARVMLKREDRDTRNVVAEQPGTGQGVLVLGAHFDTVPGVPGASDNGSGVAVLLTVAQELAQRSLPFTLRFVAFGSEELGLFGSQFHANSLSEEDRKNIIAMMNFDAVGSGASLEIEGDQQLVDTVLKYAREQGIDARQIRGSQQAGTSDHASFRAVGVPVVSFFSNDTSKIHTSQDTLELIQPRLLGETAALGISLIETLARR